MKKTLVTLISLIPAIACADEVLKTLERAADAYQAKDFVAASEEAAYAQELLIDLKSGELIKALPKPLEGWTVSQDSEALKAATFISGVGSVVGQTYLRGEASIEINLYEPNSPMLAIMEMQMNPAVLQMSPHIKTVRIAGQKGVLSEDDPGKTLMFKTRSGHMLELKSEGVDMDTIEIYVEAVKFDLIQNI